MTSQLFSTSRRRVLSFCFALLACALAAFASPAAPRSKPQASGKKQAPSASAPTPSPTPTVTLATVYGFSTPSDSTPSTNSDGVNPSALVANGSVYDGLFGTANSGGQNGTGTIFEFSPLGGNEFASLYQFSALPTSTPSENADGANPNAALVTDDDGNFYGTTQYGGANASGTIFKIDQLGNFTTLYTFSALTYNPNGDEGTNVNNDGAYPAAALVSDGNGNYYGTTTAGGTEGDGTIFKIAADGTFTVEHCFSDAEGDSPQGALVLRPNGNFLGTTAFGGVYGSGAVFEFNPSCDCLSILHSFSETGEGSYGSVNDDGAYPYAALTANAPYGPTAYYGVTSGGGNGGAGVIYSITFDPDTDAATFAVPYTFSTPTQDEATGLYLNDDGISPSAPLVLGNDGFFYGTAEYGGTSAYGTVFQFMPGSENFYTLYDFTGGTDGGYPVTALVSTGTTQFYGTTSQINQDEPIPPVHGGVRPGLRKLTRAMLPNDVTSNGYGTIYSLNVVPAAGLIAFNPDSYQVDESAGTVKITVTRTGGSSGAVSVSYETTDGSALAGTDYTSKSGTLTWANGDNASKTITVPILNRHLSSGAPEFYVEIDGPTGGALIDGDYTAEYLYAYVTINDNDPATKPVITSAKTASGQVGVPFTYTITANNQPTSYNATGLPDGLTIDTEGGVISGTPTTAGTYKITISAMNSGGTGTATLTLKVLPVTPVITSATTASGQVGQPFTYQITAANSPASFKATGLPNGLTIDNATGLISGTPVTAKTFTINLSATNAGGTGTATLTLTVAVASPVITSSLTATAQVGQPFTYQIKATGAPTSYGADGLPPGLSVNTASGLIAGTPTASGTLTVHLSAANAGGTGTAMLTLTVNPASPVITSALSAGAQVGAAFTYQITAKGNPASFNATGLPVGLSINASTGVISGTPTAAGTFNVGLSAANAGGTGTATLTLTVSAAKPAITSTVTASGQVGKAFTYQITATNNPASFNAAGLPGGLSINTTTGLISGTPTAAGTFNVGLSATSAGGTGTATLTLTVAVAPPVITSALSASAQVGAAFSYQIAASGNPTSYAATGLPNGLSINAATGLVSGTPTVAGTFNVGLSATNSSGTGMATLTLTIASTTPVITSATTASGQVGQPFSYQIMATNNPASFNAAGLPGGLSINTATGLISGTPTASGTYNVTLSAANAGGTGTATLTLTVAVAPPVITSALSASAQVGAAFSYQIAASGNPTSYAATGLPNGLSVNAATGVISGTPTAAGTFNVGLSATNSSGTGTATLTLTVSAAKPVITSAVTASGQVGQPFTYQITATNNPASFNAAGLPGGLSINTTTGLISGTPTASGTYNVTLSAANAGGTGTAMLTLTVAVAPPVITSALSASAQVGAAFSYQIAASGNPTSYTATGLPNGLSVNAATGVISGTPTVAGTFNVGLSATSAGGTGTATLTLTIASTTPVITSATTASGQVGKAFTYQITATNNPTSYGATGLPAGLSINTAAGLISGTPTAAGTFNIGLSATSAGGTGTATLTINVVGTAPVITSAITASVQEGASFSYQITATNNPTSFNATGLPAGLTINTASGIIAGAPTVAGTFTVGLSATNTGGTGTATLTLTVTASAPVITSALAAQAQLNQPFTYQIAATNAPTGYNAVNLPAGLSVDAATGLISGTPTAAGGFNVGLSATNASGTGTATLRLQVTRAAVAPPDITSAAAASAQAGMPFTYQIVASNDPTSYAAHGLPNGLAIDPSTGLITGTPVSPNTFTVGLSATNSGGTGAATLTLTVLPAAPIITSALTATGALGQSFVYQIHANHAPVSFAASNLPAGLGVDATTGLITGTPTAAGTFTVGLSATNAGGTGTATLSLTISVNAPVITSVRSTSAQAGTPFSYQITATNSPASFAAANLPPNLSVNPATGLISGTPAAVGVYSIGLSATNAGGTGTATLTLRVVAAVPVISSATTAAGEVGQAFSYQIVASNSPTNYAVVGLPSGLVLDKTTGLISGTPNASGTFSVSLSATNSGGTGTATLTLTILPAAPQITSSLTANTHVGRTFAYKITASRAPAYYGVKGLPYGVTLDGATGLISGTPTASGTFTVTLSATNAGGTGTATLILTVFPAAPTITSGLTANGQIGQAFTYRITATPTPTSYNASDLPPGLGVNSATGIISGTPTVTGVFSVRLLATNGGGTGAATLTLTVTTPSATKPTITSTNTALGRVGTPFSYQITATNNPTSYGTSPLPAGLGVNATTGLISGTPTQPGTFAVTIAAANAAGTATASLTLTIADTTQPTVAVVSPPNNITVVVGSAVPLAASITDPDKVLAQVTFLVNGATIGSVGATGPYTETFTPAAAGTYTLSAVATDVEGRTSASSVTITAIAAQAANPAPSANLLTPVNGENLAAGSTLTLSAMAVSPSAAGLDHVSIIVDGAVIATFDPNGNPITTDAAGKAAHRQDASTGSGAGTVFQTSYTLPGIDKLLAMIVAATDKLGQTSMSTAATFHSTVTTDRAPVVSFENLAANILVAVGASEQAQVNASDPDATATSSASTGGPTRQDASPDAVIAELTYFLDGVNIGSSTTPPYTFNFTAPAPGKYTLHAVATDGAGLSTVSAPVIVEADVPVVTVTTGGDGDAVEGGANGKVVVTRTGDTSAPLTVFYKTKGSGVAGVDYQTLTGSVTIPAGSSKAKIKIKALDDTTAEGVRKAKVKLLPSAAGLYTVGDPFLAKVTIMDND